jgi:hypothetical protein
MFKLEIGAAGGIDYSDFYALAGVLVTAIAAFVAVVVQVQSAHRARMLEYRMRGIALQNEALARFYHIQWLVTELRKAVEGPNLAASNVEAFSRELNDNIGDTPVVASFDIMKEFLKRAWPDLANIHPKQMPLLAGVFRRFEACLENYERILGLLREGISGRVAGKENTAMFWHNVDDFTEAIKKNAADIDIYFTEIGLTQHAPTKE